MKSKIVATGVMCALLSLSMPVKAQVFWKPADYNGGVVTGLEPGIGVPLPNATPAEQRAAIMWNVRSGLNVAALQCGFVPTTRTLENYNGMLRNHQVELAGAFDTLSKYFKRTSKTPQAGQKALDTYGTKTYSSFSAVAALLDFCHVAGHVSAIGLFAPKGSFGTFATERIRQLRNGMTVRGEQQFKRQGPLYIVAPKVADQCWKKKKYIC